MKIVKTKLQWYELQLRRPILLKGQTLEKRSGAILTLMDSAGRLGYGEIAPLPSLHKETLTEAVERALGAKEKVLDMQVKSDYPFLGISDRMAESAALPPSVLFAFEMAFFDLYLQGLSSRNNLTALQVPVCGLTSAASESFFADLDEMLEKGYSAVKVKVGAGSVSEDAQKIQTAKEIVQGRMTVRLDVNRSWNLEEAISFCHQIDSDCIEYVEEPVSAIGDQKLFVEETDVPLALDETLCEGYFDDTCDLNHVSAFVLKPGLVGGLRQTASMIEMARNNNIKPVLSSSFQSGLTVRILYLFAGYMGLSDIPVGLDTLKWFVEDCLECPIQIERGSVNLQSLLQQKPVIKEGILGDAVEE